MDSQNQLTYFVLCIAVGFVSGVVYEIFSFLRLCFGCTRGKNKIFGVALDIIFCIAFAILTVFSRFCFHFPDFRAYFWLGYGFGGILYLKTLHKIIAFFEKLCYNKLSQRLKTAKNKKKTLKKREG